MTGYFGFGIGYQTSSVNEAVGGGDEFFPDIMSYEERLLFDG